MNNQKRATSMAKICLRRPGHVISCLKSELCGKRFEDLGDIRIAVRKLMTSYKKEWFRDIFSK